MSNFRHVLVHLHPTKEFVFTNPDANTRSADRLILSECKASVILYINQLNTLNSHLREPKKRELIYIPSRYLTVYVSTCKTTIRLIDEKCLLDYFAAIGYVLAEKLTKEVERGCKCYKFECSMNLASNINMFQQQTASVDPAKPVTFIELTDLKVDIKFNISAENSSIAWTADGINELFRNYMNSLLVSILEPNYPFVFNADTRACLNKHLQTVSHLTTIDVPISFILKTLSFDTIYATTTFKKLLTSKIKKLPISDYKDFPP